MQQPGAVRWPQGKRGCMALAFDLDGPTGDAMLNGSLWSTPEYFTFGAYGPFRALGRLLDLPKTPANIRADLHRAPID